MTIQSMGFSRQECLVGGHSLFQGIFPTQGLTPGLPHCRRILYQLSHQRSPGANRLSCTLFSRFHIGVLIYSIWFLDSLHSIWQSLDLSTSLQMTQFCFLLCLSNISLPIYIYIYMYTHTHTHIYIIHYTVEVTNRFKGLDMLDRVPEELCTEVHDRRQGTRPSPRKRNAKRKMVVWGGLTNSCEEKRSQKQRRKGKIYPFEYRVPKNSKER